MKETYKEKDELRLVRSILIVSGIVFIIGLTSLTHQAISEGLLAISIKWQTALGFLGISTLATIVLAISSFTPFGLRIVQCRTGAQRVIAGMGAARFIAVILPIGIPSLLFLKVNELFLTALPVRLLIVWGAVLIAAEFTVAPYERQRWLETAIALTIVHGVAYRISLLMLFVNDYPLTLGWSEGSRYYYASLFFAQQQYGAHINPSVLHPTRYILQGLAFLFPQAGLLFHRFWQVLLWILATGATGFFLARRIQSRTVAMTLAIIGFSVLYLFQGPVYYYLLIMVILILAGFNREKLWVVSLLVVLGSIWAGASRINWFSMPGFLAATLYLLEVPRSERPILRYWAWPVLWVALGTAVAFFSQVAYIQWSGNPIDQFSSSFTSSLLWYRLLPNATFSLGILPATAVASLSTLAILWRTRHRWLSGMGWERILPIGGVIAVLLVGGVLVSLKIGGGSNLHNLDAYLVILGIVAAYVYFERFETETITIGVPVRPGPVIHISLLLIPMLFALSEGEPLLLPDPARVEETLTAIQTQAQHADETHGDILFISQRHLLTFDTVEGIRLIPEYETVFLMEMAMSGNHTYLDEFHRKLDEHAFNLIIVEPLSRTYQARDRDFSEENNAWVREISEPIFCNYEPIVTFQDTKVQIFRPRLIPCEGQ